MMRKKGRKIDSNYLFDQVTWTSSYWRDAFCHVNITIQISVNNYPFFSKLDQMLRLWHKNPYSCWFLNKLSINKYVLKKELILSVKRRGLLVFKIKMKLQKNKSNFLVKTVLELKKLRHIINMMKHLYFFDSTTF